MSNGIKINGLLSRSNKQTATMTGGTITGINSSYIEVIVPLGAGTTANNIDTTNNQDGDIISITKHSSTSTLLIQSNNINKK